MIPMKIAVNDLPEEFANPVSARPLHDRKAMRCNATERTVRHGCCLKQYGRRSAKPACHEGRAALTWAALTWAALTWAAPAAFSRDAVQWQRS